MPDVATLDSPAARRASHVHEDGSAHLNPHDLAAVRRALADAERRRITLLERCPDCRNDGPCPRHAPSAEAVEVYRSLAARLAPKESTDG